MASVVSTVAALGVGDYDGQSKIIKYGPPGQEERAAMGWRADLAPPRWISRPRIEITMRNSWPLTLDTIPTAGTAWGYVTWPLNDGSNAFPDTNMLPETGPSHEGQSSYSWNPRAIRHADAAFASGLKLQEKIIVSAWLWAPTDDYDLATVLYPANVDDDVSNLLLPDANIGTIVKPLGGLRRFQVTPWADSGVQACAKENLAPHLYTRRTVHASSPNPLEFFTSYWRWVGVPPPGGASSRRPRSKAKPKAKPRLRSKR